ncbi:MAG: ATP-binding protein [Spirochaetes bacterium]|nr:ATP-binding protein [Spirochaetota bacterium]
MAIAAMNNETPTIPYDSMKAQILRSIDELSMKGVFVAEAYIGFEKGATRICIPIPELSPALIMHFLSIIKDHLEHIRIHAFSDGYYAVQALNKNLFKTENIFDNLKIEFSGLTTNFKIECTKKGNLSQEEINCITALIHKAYASAKENPVTRLIKRGASVYTDAGGLDWGYIAGYEEVKRIIRESIILPLKNPKVYDSIAEITRKTFEINRPRAILFEGPPGVGKTTIARIIAKEVQIPLVYVPVESIMSKWYGQSSQNLAEIFDSCEDLGGSILFIDEIDSLAGSRDQNMYEATRRILSVLLRRLDGIGAITNTIVIGATNRKQDLDHALISRFDQTIHFPLPGEQERASIFANYAKHLSQDELSKLAIASANCSGRTIKDLCEQTERRWARKLIIKNLPPSPPPFEYYYHTVKSFTAEPQQ